MAIDISRTYYFLLCEGVVEKIMKVMEKSLFPTEEEGLVFMDKHLKKVNCFLI